MQIALLVVLLYTAASENIEYLSVPFRVAENSTHQAHNINLEVNRFVYAIDVTLENSDDFIFDLAQASQHHPPTSTPDYRKYNDSVYGIMRPLAVQRVDPRLSFVKRLTRNLFYYLKNIEQKMLWTNQKYIKQLDWSLKTSYLSEGTFNVGPTKQIIAFDDVLKYSRYMNSPTVTWKLDDNAKTGQIILGHFPTDQLHDASQYDNIHLRKGLSSWLVDITAIKLKNIGQTKYPLNDIEVLTNSTSQFKVNLSQKKLKLPKSAMNSLAKYLPGCQQAIHNSGNYPLVCQTSKVGYYRNFVVQLYTQSGFAIDIPVEDLMSDLSNAEGDKFIMDVELGTNDNYHISPIILKQYLVGINYRTSSLFIGRKASDSLLDRYILFNLFVALNALALIPSLLVISMASRFQPPSQQNQPQELSQRPVCNSKTGGYVIPEDEQYSPHGEVQKMTEWHTPRTNQ